jgi:hypothetical protein
MKVLQEIIHRAATDAEFRSQLIADPREATRTLGLVLDEETLGVLVQMQERFVHWLSSVHHADPADPDWYRAPAVSKADPADPDWYRAPAAGPADPDWYRAPAVSPVALGH